MGGAGVSMRFHQGSAFLQLLAIPSIDQLNHPTYPLPLSKQQKMAHTNSFNTNSYNNVWNNYTITNSRSQLLTWLSPLEPSLRHQDIRERRVRGVGEWLLQTEEFRSWCAGSGEDESDGAVLFGHGDPGVGKTFIW